MAAPTRSRLISLVLRTISHVAVVLRRHVKTGQA
jgi:hypothetical protein